MPTTATHAAAAPMLIFSMNDQLVPEALKDLSHEQLWHALSDRNNSMLWVAGHIVQTRAMVLQMLGEPIDTGWGSLFDRGATVGEPSRYPSGSEIERVSSDISVKLRAALSALTDEQLARPASLQIPGVETLAGELAFFALHDSYHVGQLAYIRKGLGYPGLVG